MRRLFRDSSGRDIALIFLPIAVLAGLALWGLTYYVQPAPPKVVVMGTGAPDGAYHAYAQRYKSHLAKYGITLELKPSAGAMENIDLLKARKDDVTVALVQGGLANAENAPGLVTLGSLFYEPTWLFYGGASKLRILNDLRGKRIAIGPPGSGTQALILKFLHEIKIAKSPTVLREIGGLEAAKALETGDVDAVFYVASINAPAVQRLLTAPGVNIHSIERADAIVRRQRFFTKHTLPQGAADLARNIPPRDVTLLAVTANLVAVEDIHPVIVDLLLEAAKEVHGGGGMFQRAGEFPAPRDLDLPLAPDAERFYKSSPSVLRRYLPFWMVVWVNRFIVVAIPLLIIAIPLLRNIPALYRWRMRRRIYRWYGELRVIENAVRSHSGDAEKHLERLNLLEEQVESLHVPNAYSGELYAFLVHVQWVRNLLRELISGRSPAANPAGGAKRPCKEP